MKAAASVQNLRTMDAAFTIAQAHLRVASDSWDREPHLLAVQNGVVDLQTVALHPSTPDFRMTRRAGCAYDPAARAPRFERFLCEVQPDAEVRAYLQRLIGYAATGEAREQKFVSFLGDGGNGKSTFVGAIMDALGDYAMKANPGLLAEQAPDKPRNDLAALAGARMLSISELPANLRADAALIKSITGSDVINARFLHREFFEFRPCFTPIFDTNHPLNIREDTPAIARRRVTIPWSVTIPAEKSDSSLRERLSQELPGILAWIVEGARQYYRAGLVR
jgi:putative DNA primase/helicase